MTLCFGVILIPAFCLAFFIVVSFYSLILKSTIT